MVAAPAQGLARKGNYMARKFVAATVSALLCLSSVTPAMAHDSRFTGFDAPRGATLTANLRVPLGRQGKASKSKATYGLTLGLGREMGAGYDGRTFTREMRLADLRFSTDGELDRASVANFNLADPDLGKRLNMTAGGSNLVVIGLIGAGVAVCVLAECHKEIFGDDDDDTN